LICSIIVLTSTPHLFPLADAYEQAQYWGRPVWPPLLYRFLNICKRRPALEIDTADQGQLETTSDRVNRHYEGGTAARPLEPARTPDKVEDPVISTSG